MSCILETLAELLCHVLIYQIISLLLDLILGSAVLLRLWYTFIMRAASEPGSTLSLGPGYLQI